MDWPGKVEFTLKAEEPTGQVLLPCAKENTVYCRVPSPVSTESRVQRQICPAREVWGRRRHLSVRQSGQCLRASPRHWDAASWAGRGMVGRGGDTTYRLLQPYSKAWECLGHSLIYLETQIPTV